MATLAELTRQHTDLRRDEVDHLQKLVGDWGLLADFCFADLLLYARAADGRWLIVAHVRPATGPTLYQDDRVGSAASAAEGAILDRAAGEVSITGGEVPADPEPTQVLAIPVRCGERTLAVLTRESSTGTSRRTGELERAYLSIFDRLAAMTAEGSFPFEGRWGTITAAPRVGDGVIILDADVRVAYASPNAVSALHRIGINANVLGLRLAEIGIDDSTVRASYERGEPVIEESEHDPDVTLLTYSIPILAHGAITGGVLLVRDVSELRRRDRLLLSKDATIREIHHRVKNNLQTISSLLRLQARRLTAPEAKAAVNESVRRIRTIALVHETLSREAGEDVAFGDIVRPLLRLVEEGLQSPDRPVSFGVSGDGGKLPAIIATPLSVVLTELLQNAVDHGFPDGSGGGSVHVELAHDASELTITVTDDGVGVAPDFSLDNATGLGLVIVRTLVTSELAGTITMDPATAEDLAAAGLTRREQGTGTVVRLSVPTDPAAR